jgi:hypothetical protein
MGSAPGSALRLTVRAKHNLPHPAERLQPKPVFREWGGQVHDCLHWIPLMAAEEECVK